MYRKNVASQHIGFALVNASTGAALPGATVTVKRVIDGGSQASGTGTVTDKGNGQYNYAMSQADTNGNNVSLLFTAVSDGAVPVEKTFITTAADPTDAVKLGLTGFPANFASMVISAGGSVQIQIGVKKNTALANFQFVMRDASNAPQPGKTVSVTRCIDNGSFSSGTLSAVTEIANGAYRVNFAAADLNGNCIMLRATASGCVDTFIEFVTAP